MDMLVFNTLKLISYTSLLQAEFLGDSSLSPSWIKESSDNGLVPT